LVLDCGMTARITGDIPHFTFIAGFTYPIAGLYRSRRQPVTGVRAVREHFTTEAQQ